jgi:hypothetical protein
MLKWTMPTLSVKTKIVRKEMYGINESNTVQPNSGIHQTERKQLATNQKGKTVGKYKRSETFCSLIHIKCKL